MLLGRISRLCFVILVFWLCQKASFVGSFELFRGHNDVFSNSKCSQAEYFGHASGDGLVKAMEYDECANWCQKYGANCKDMSCSYCICNGSDKNYTYIGNEDGDGRCKSDEEVLPESVPTTSFRVRNGNHGTCLTVNNSTNQVTAINCNSFSPKTHWIWIWIGKSKRLMNIKTLQCVEVASQVSDGLRRVTMKPCGLDLWGQTLSCNSNGRTIWNKRQGKKAYLMLSSSKVLFATTIRWKRQFWYKFRTSNAKICTSAIKYKGCYRFSDGSFLRFLSYDEQCSKQEGVCVHEEDISAPIFAENTKCSLNWEGSEYLRYGNSWKSVWDNKNNYFVLETNKKRLLKINIGASKKLNGSLIKLNIICKSKVNRQNTDEEHCVLLKFETLPGFEVQTSTIVPSTTKSTDAFTDATTIIEPFMRLSSSSITKIKATKEHPSLATKAATITKLFPLKTVTSSPSSSSTTLSSKSNFSNRSSSQSSKAVAISVPIVLLIIITCVAAGVLVIYRRRKGGEPELTRNEEEMQSCESDVAQNPSTNVYEDPTQTYEPLKVNQRGTGDEQPYQGLVGLHSQDTSVYDYIDDNSATNPGTEGEYSDATNEILPRSFAPSQPLPSAPIVYQTLEEPDGSDNPAFEHDKLSHNNGNAPKNELFDEKFKSPVYETLEEQEAVQNPKSLDSVEKSLDQQNQNPVYQTFENSNAGQDISSETFGNSWEGGVPSGDPIYHVVDNP